MVERLLGRKERREKIIFYHSPHTFFIMRKEVVFKFSLEFEFKLEFFSGKLVK